MTIAELRAEQVQELARYKNPNPTPDDIAEAQHNMNSFYRLCGLDERCSILSNDAGQANSRRVKKMEDKAYRWCVRLDKIFHDTYGLKLEYCGTLPSIGITNESGGFTEKIARYFYD